MSRRTQIVFFVLGGFFITNAIVAEFIGGKLFTMPIPEWTQAILSWVGIDQSAFVVSVGILPWPIVFVATDLVNEFFGRKGVRFYTYVTMALIFYALVLVNLADLVPIASFSPITSEAFNMVFITSSQIMLASIVAFGVSQFFDVLVFSSFRRKTGEAHLWARATGSTLVSQLVDTFVITYLAFVLTGKLTFDQFLRVATVSYIFKIGVAVASTPLCYLGHHLIRRYLGHEEAERLIQENHARVDAGPKTK